MAENFPSPNRRFFDPFKQRLETSREIFERELKGKEEAKLKYPEDLELKDVLKTVDFGILREQLKIIALKSGIDPKSINLVLPERVFHDQKREQEEPAGIIQLGAYHPNENIITINYDAVIKEAKERGRDPKSDVVHALIHEEVHATSATMCSGNIEPDGTFFAFIQGGYHTSTFTKRPDRSETEEMNFYEFFDEGVTEKLALELSGEYFRATGHSADSPKLAPQSGYLASVFFVEFLIDHLSEETQATPEAVWRAIVRGKYRIDEHLFDQETQTLLKEIYDEDFLAQLETISEDVEMLGLSVELLHKLSPHSSAFKKLRSRLLSHIEMLNPENNVKTL